MGWKEGVEKEISYCNVLVTKHIAERNLTPAQISNLNLITERLVKNSFFSSNDHDLPLFRYS